MKPCEFKCEAERLRAVAEFLACGYACVHYPDQDRDHPGIQYPDCVDPEIECCMASALAALDEEAGE